MAAKVIFVLHKRSDMTRDYFVRYWSSEPHTSIAKRIPGLTKWVQNRIPPDPSQGDPVCDGVGEMWFDSSEVLQEALASPEFAAAMDDARNFLDLSKSGMIVVEEVSMA